MLGTGNSVVTAPSPPNRRQDGRGQDAGPCKWRHSSLGKKGPGRFLRAADTWDEAQTDEDDRREVSQWEEEQRTPPVNRGRGCREGVRQGSSPYRLINYPDAPKGAPAEVTSSPKE